MNDDLIRGKHCDITTGVPVRSSYAQEGLERPEGLTAGVLPAVDYTDAGWAKFYRGLNRSVTVDLGGEFAVNGFSVTFLQNRAAGIYTPPSAELYVSENGSDFMLAYSVPSAVSRSDKDARYSVFELRDAARYKASYVRLVFETQVFVFAADFKLFGGECDGSELPFAPEKSRRPDLGMLPKKEGFSSPVILYHGYWDSTMNYGEKYVKNTVDDLLPYVGYVTRRGKVTDTMFDSAVFLLLQSRAPSGGKTVCFGKDDTDRTVKSDFDYFTDNLFLEGYNMDALDCAYGIVKGSLGLDAGSRFGVSVQLPYVYEGDAPFGDINGDGADEYTRNADERLAVYDYYIRATAERFAEKNYSNLKLVGFYQGCEGVPFAMGDGEYAMFTRVNALIHSHGYAAVWIPSFLGAGFDIADALGFDFAYMQPNYMFHSWQPQSLAEFAMILEKYRLGAEIEMNHTCVLPGCPTFEQDNRKYVDYLDAGAKYGYMDAALAFYQGAGPGSMFTAAYSDDRRARLLYDKTYRFIKGSYDPEEPDAEYFIKEENETVKNIEEIAKDTAEAVKNAAGSVKDHAVKTAGEVKEKTVQAAGEASAKAKEIAGSAAQRAKEFAASASEKAKAAQQKASDTLSEAKEKTVDAAKEAKRKAGEKLCEAKEKTGAKAEEVKAKAKETAKKASDAYKEMPTEKKFAVAAAIVGVGVAVAAIITGGKRRK